ncbi:MAG: BrnA antitoxin family protein [Rickettsiales bacterium]|jgi:uncharacterized protein (DUF4415 family)|nr:BrnA antitoxin family protein [Rickettsiales bacterium]
MGKVWLTDDMVEKMREAVRKLGDVSTSKKVSVRIPLSPDVSRALKSLGPNYTTRADRLLRGALVGIGAL